MTYCMSRRANVASNGSVPVFSFTSTLILSLVLIACTSQTAAAFAADELRFSLPEVRTSTLTVPARVISVTRTDAAKMYAGVVQVKTRSAQRPQKSTLSFQSISWKQTLAPLNVTSIASLIPETIAPLPEEKLFGIDRIFEVRIDPSLDVFEACRRIAENPDVEYVTPVFVRTTSFTPNDTRFASQYALARIQAEKAWDINMGTASVVIADVDSGVDFEHEDLRLNRWINVTEVDGNEIDDDANGYVDDVSGYNFASRIPWPGQIGRAHV